jgi:hypothetical protein
MGTGVREPAHHLETFLSKLLEHASMHAYTAAHCGQVLIHV